MKRTKILIIISLISSAIFSLSACNLSNSSDSNSPQIDDPGFPQESAVGCSVNDVMNSSAC